MTSNFVSVLDLGSTKAVCLAAEASASGQLDILAVGVEENRGVRKGVVADLDAATEAAGAAIKAAEQMMGRPMQPLVVGVAGSHLEGVSTQGIVPIFPRTRAINREDVLQVINHSRQLLIPPDYEQIQAIPREFRIDGQKGIHQPIGMSGSRLEVVTYIVTGQTTHLQNLERAIERTGHRIDQIVLAPLAAGLAVLKPEEIELGAVLVDIGGGTTDVAVFSEGALAYSASIPVAGQLVTSDLSKLLKTTPEEAERLKVGYGHARAKGVSENESVDVLQLGQTVVRPLQRKVMCEIIESRMREIASMVRQQIERSGLVGLLPGGVVLTGGGAAMSGTAELFEEVLRHKGVRIAEPDVSDVLAAPSTGMATAFGLARYAAQCVDEELSPAGVGDWKERIKTIWSHFGGRA